MSTIWLTIGLPASGKTTWAKAQVRASKGNAIHTSRDDIRLMIFGHETNKNYRYTPSKEKMVTRIQRKIVRTAIADGKDVYVADTNLNPTVVSGWRNLADSLGADFKVNTDFLDLHPLACVDRDSRRRDSVGEDVIMGMVKKYPQFFQQWEKETNDVGAVWKLPNYDKTYDPDRHRPSHLYPQIPDERPHAIIVDLDGTVARMVDRGPYEEDKVGNDALHSDVADLIELYAHHASATILFTSARSEDCREATEEWLSRYFGKDPNNIYWKLFMRKSGDVRNDAIIKEEIFWNDIDPNYIVLCAFDDRDRVVNMWRQIGLRCYQVSHGNF